MTDRESSIKERLDRLVALEDCKRVVEALDLATSALGYVAEANTLPAAKTTASGALLGIEKELAKAAGSEASE